MALITDYDSLKSEIANYAWRTDDTEFEASVDNMIQMAGTRLNRKLALRVMDTDVPLTGVFASRFIPLPSDYLEPYALNLTTFGQSTSVKAYSSDNMPLSLISGVPSGWAIDGVNIGLDRPCNQAHTFQFRYRKSFVISADITTNWLLTNHPDIYLAAALVWGGLFGKDDADTAKWKTILDEGIEELAWQEARSVAIAPLSFDPAIAGRGGFNIYTGQ